MQRMALHDWTWAGERARKLATAVKNTQFDIETDSFTIDTLDEALEDVADGVLAAS